MTASSYDAAARKVSKRTGRQTGCWVYIPGDELAKAGYLPTDPPPFYRVSVYRRLTNAASAIFSLYRER